MMEVIPINTNTLLKADLWAERIRSFQKSGLSRKDWCQQNEIPQSTLNYWIRKCRLSSKIDPLFYHLLTRLSDCYVSC